MNMISNIIAILVVFLGYFYLLYKFEKLNMSKNIFKSIYNYLFYQNIQKIDF